MRRTVGGVEAGGEAWAPGAQDAVVLVVHVGQPGKRVDFGLSKEMVEGNAPCYFSALCSEQAFFAESSTREVHLLHKDPEIFGHIVRFLQGYKIMLYEDQRRELEAVKADASYFGLTKLMDDIDETMMANIKANLGPHFDPNVRNGKVVDVLDRRRLHAASLVEQAAGRYASVVQGDGRQASVAFAAATYGPFGSNNGESPDSGESPGTGICAANSGIYCLELNSAHVLLYYDVSRTGYCDLFWRRGHFLHLRLDHHQHVVHKIRQDMGPTQNVEFTRDTIWCTNGYVVINHRNWRYHYTPEDIDFYITSSDISLHASDPKYGALLSITCSPLRTYGHFLSWRVSKAVTMCEVRRTGEDSFVAQQIILQVEIDAGTNSAFE